uniref:KIB1-4 beta-propeller domain-containing protein n=1 Tax=Aegilops tauschii TaxID=37682 RepID=M8CI29_AEGTA
MARPAPLPTLPWLIFDNDRDDKCNMRRVYCPEDDGFLRFPLPKALFGKSFAGTHDGGWVAALGDDKHLAIVNLFSGAEVPLHAKDMTSFYAYKKVIFSESPTSSRCILATITTRDSIALCRIGCPVKRWTAKIFNGPRLIDIVFYNGKLYALTDLKDLVKFKIGVNKDSRPVVTVELHMQIGGRPFKWATNIVELHGKLAMVAKHCFYDNTYRKHFFFHIFVLVDESTKENTPKWEEVTTLGDCALFFGRMWTKALCVPAAGCGGVKRSAIYADDVTYLTSFDGHGDCVFPMGNGSSEHATKFVGPYTCCHVPCGMWVLPPDF